jgi:hypothetical protein
MKKQEFQLLVKSGAVAAADLVKRGDLWSVWVGVGPSRSEASGEPIRGRSGEVRTWADMVRAYEFIRSAGFVGKVEVDEASALTVTKTQAGQWRWALMGPDGREIAGGGGYEFEADACEDGQAELEAQSRRSAVVVVV